MYCISDDVDKRLILFGLEGKEHNTIVSLMFSITKIFRKSYNEGIMKQVGALYPFKYLVNKLFKWKNLYNLRMNDGYLVMEYPNAFNIVAIQLMSIDFKIYDEDN